MVHQRLRLCHRLRGQPTTEGEAQHEDQCTRRDHEEHPGGSATGIDGRTPFRRGINHLTPNTADEARRRLFYCAIEENILYGNKRRPPLRRSANHDNNIQCRLDRASTRQGGPPRRGQPATGGGACGRPPTCPAAVAPEPSHIIVGVHDHILLPTGSERTIGRWILPWSSAAVPEGVAFSRAVPHCAGRCGRPVPGRQSQTVQAG